MECVTTVIDRERFVADLVAGEGEIRFGFKVFGHDGHVGLAIDFLGSSRDMYKALVRLDEYVGVDLVTQLGRELGRELEEPAATAAAAAAIVGGKGRSGERGDLSLIHI